MDSSLPGSKIIIVLLALFFLPAVSAFASNNNPSDSVSVRSEESVRKELLLRSEIVRQAKKYLGIGYRYAGRSPKTGFDCSGFTSYVMSKFSVPVSGCSRTQATQGQAISLKEVKPGDIVVFKRSRSRSVSHVAMVVENNEEGVFMIHSSSSRGVVIDNLSESSYWKPKIFAARDILSISLDVAVLPPSEVQQEEGADSAVAQQGVPGELMDAACALLSFRLL